MKTLIIWTEHYQCCETPKVRKRLPGHLPDTTSGTLVNFPVVFFMIFFYNHENVDDDDPL